MATTFTLIQTYTLTTATASISFTGIPSTFTDICLKFSLRSDNANVGQAILVTYNGSSAYAYKYIEGAGSGTPASGTGTDKYIGDLPGSTATASTFNNGELYIPNYGSSVVKSISADSVTENNGTLSYQVFMAQTYAITSAITSISLASGGASALLVTYSSASLYGILKA